MQANSALLQGSKTVDPDINWVSSAPEEMGIRMHCNRPTGCVCVNRK